MSHPVKIGRYCRAGMRKVRAGCNVCHGENVSGWESPNAQGVAARHTDVTGHKTWVEVVQYLFYETDSPPEGDRKR